MKKSTLIESLLPVRHSIHASSACGSYDPVAQQSATRQPGQIIRASQSDDGAKHSDFDDKISDSDN